MRYNVKLAAYSEGEFMQDSRILTPDSKIEVKLIPKMRESKDGEDFIIVQLTVIYTLDSQEIMKYGGVAVYYLKDLHTLLDNEEFASDLKQEIWEQSFPLFRGILCEKLRGTNLESLFLPSLPNEEIVKIKYDPKSR